MSDSTVTVSFGGREHGTGSSSNPLMYRNLRKHQGLENSLPGADESLSSSDFMLDWEEKIAKWKKAAEAGDPEAQVLLGICYYFGDGIPRDVEEAARWYRKAAEQGHAEAQCRLGLCYDAGTGVLQDKAEAMEWYRRAAEQGHPDALHLVGGCYYYGWGVHKDEEEAVKWLQKATEHGVESAVALLKKMGKE